MSAGSSNAPVAPQAPSGPSKHNSAAVPADAAPKPKPSVPWGPVAAIAYAVFLYLAAQLLAAAALYLGLHLLGWDSHRVAQWLGDDTFAQFLYILMAEALTIGGVVWFVRRRGARMSLIGWNRPKLKYLWIALAGFAVYMVAYIVIAVLVSIFVPSIDMEQKQNIGFTNVQGSVGMLLTFVSLVVLPPLAEEIVFRGFVYTGLRSRMRFIWATLLTSILFAIPHLQFGEGAPPLWIAAIDTLVLSLVLCYVRERTGSLWSGIIIHSLKNGVAFAALFLIH